MAKCSESDLAALTESGPLLRFAVERVKDLDPDLALALAEARAAADGEHWTPQISQKFWNTFAKLCDLVQPVTMDCLAAAHRNIDPPRWRRFFNGERKSLAERSSSRYLFALLLLLALILPIQLYVWTCSNLSKKIDDFFSAEKVKYAALAQDYTKIDGETRGRPGDTWSADQSARATKVIVDSISIHDDLDRVDIEAYFLERISSGFLRRDGRPNYPRPKNDTAWYDFYHSVTDRLSKTQLSVLHIQEKANLIVGVLGAYILPILFGTIGAVAYVIRTISDQISASTFSTSSPIRHVMRAALGAMAGVVVGLFGGLSNQLSLSPLAVAFLAGYGVEAVFSMFDGIIDKFKQTKATA